MRFLVALILAMMLSLAVFYFMRQLIQHDYQMPEKLSEFSNVEFIEEKKKPPQPTEKNASSARDSSQPEQQPNMPQLDMVASRALSPIPSDIALNGATQPLDLTTGLEDGVPVFATVSVDGEGLNFIPGQGLVEQGTEQLRPFAAIRPNIPELAYRQRINGWVIAAFTVTQSGHVINIKVLDADPRGVFEDEAAKALAKWVYPLNEKGIAVRVTQRLEFDWMNYKENIKEDKREM